MQENTNTIKRLYIIGNGFDCHHGIKSSYNDFKKWFYCNDKELFNEFVELFPSALNKIDTFDYWWADLEINLSEVQGIYNYLRKLIVSGTDYSDFGYCTIRDSQINAINAFDVFVVKFMDEFKKWLCQLNEPNSNKVNFEVDNSLFLNFNYTQTLEIFYGIPQSQIMHIHGCISDENSIIMGHDSIEEDLIHLLEKEEYDGANTRFDNSFSSDEMYSLLHFGYDKAFSGAIKCSLNLQKGVTSIIKNNISFFDKLDGVDEINVYGFSFSEIDMPYIEKINEIAPFAKWTIYYHSNRDFRHFNGLKLNSQLIPW